MHGFVECLSDAELLIAPPRILHASAAGLAAECSLHARSSSERRNNNHIKPNRASLEACACSAERRLCIDVALLTEQDRSEFSSELGGSAAAAREVAAADTRLAMELPRGHDLCTEVHPPFYDTFDEVRYLGARALGLGGSRALALAAPSDVNALLAFAMNELAGSDRAAEPLHASRPSARVDCHDTRLCADRRSPVRASHAGRAVAPPAPAGPQISEPAFALIELAGSDFGDEPTHTSSPITLEERLDAWPRMDLFVSVCTPLVARIVGLTAYVSPQTSESPCCPGTSRMRRADALPRGGVGFRFLIRPVFRTFKKAFDRWKRDAQLTSNARQIRAFSSSRQAPPRGVSSATAAESSAFCPT